MSALPFVTPSPRLCADQSRRSHVIGEELFRGALVRERKRADRSNEPFLLFLISLREPTDADSSMWAAAIEALTAGKRETDILGWFSRQSVLGVIVPEIASSDASVIRTIDARLRRELARRFGPDALPEFSIQLHVHPELDGAREGEFTEVDPLLEPLRPRDVGSAASAVAKRTVDVLGSSALLLLLSPLFLLIAALVKLTSSGPVFFIQTRIGQMAKPFTMLKFRTMRTGVDHTLHHDFVTKFIKSSDEVREPGKDAPFKIANDPRITVIGRILRRTSMDELPQFWNVLRGEMSLVGPRPPLPYEVEKYQRWHCRRVLEAKPGVTGLWQVAGRSRTTFDEMVRLDLRYARTCSLWTDIKILLATPRAVISGKGAA